MSVEVLSWNENPKTFQSSITQFEAMMQELSRLASFVSWPAGDTLSPLTLARSGFVYSGNGYQVSCPLCGIKLDGLTRGDDPAAEHRKRSPDCVFVNQAATVDYPQPVRSSLSEVSSSLQPLRDVYISASRRLQGVDREPEVLQPNACLSLSPRVDRLNPDYELLRRECIRLDTFYDWPSSAHAFPEALARDGFFYTGSIDRVRCAFCRSSLHSWAAGDNPTEEHRKHFPQCPFVLNLNVGNIRIENDVRIGSGGQGPQSLASPVTTGASENQMSTRLPSVEASLSTPTVRAALEMGFPEENVKQVVQQHLTETGQLFPSAESLVERLLSLGVSQIYSVSGTQKTATPASSTLSSANLALPAPASSLIVPSSSATGVVPAALLVASLSVAAAASTVASTSAATQSAASASFVAEFERRTGAEGGEGTSNLRSESAKKGNGSGKKRRRGPKKDKIAASVAGSCSSQAGSSEPQAVSGETSSGPATAAANPPDFVVDPEEQELLEENSRLKDARTCKVCMDKEVNTVFLPCGHLICCDNCSPQVRNCPLCRTLIRGTVKTYLS